MVKKINKIYSNLQFLDIKIKDKFNLWKEEIRSHKRLILLSLILLTISTFLDLLSGNYVLEAGVAISPDIILDHLGPYNLQFLFGWMYLLIMVCLFFFPLFFKIKELHKVISQFSLLIIMRSFFISLTHLKTPLTAIPAKFPVIFQPFVFENDLFFSGHTATPFLGFLLFRNSPIRWFFLIASIIMGATSLLMHRHYSIDVFAAFFIVYGTYKIGNWLFCKIEKNY